MKDADRELLELAAKAAGVDCEWLDGWRGPVIGRGMASRCWLPLEDGGDAFRLAVKCGISLDFAGGYVAAYAGGHMGKQFTERADEAGACRAIVRAAAAIGKEMP